MSTRYNIASIKIVKVPSTWTYKFELVSMQEFIDRINSEDFTSVSNPVMGTIAGGSFLLYPAPSASEDLEIYITLASSTQDIDITTEPELGAEWDKCLEWFVTAQYLPERERVFFENKYNAELKRLRGLNHRKEFTLFRAGSWNGND